MIRPTRAGIGIAMAVVLCGIIGRVLGLSEMFVLAAICIGLLLLAAVYVISARLNLAISRVVAPARVRVGSSAKVNLTLLNRARRATPLVHLHDPIGTSTGASLMLAPIRGRRESRVAYHLPTVRRGIVEIGPLELTVGDPLGLFRSRLTATEQSSILVHPEVLALAPLNSNAGSDPTAQHQPTRTLANSGEEFFALRPYIMGDELKRVNWRATARLDELVVRQEENPKTGRVTVLLDVRRESYEDDGFERAVSAALSVLYSAFHGDDALRLVTSANTAADIRSRAELDAVDEQMAIIKPDGSASLTQALDRLSKAAHGGTLVIITGFLGSYYRESRVMAERRFGRVIAVSCQEPGANDTTTDVLHHYPGSDFISLWKATVASPVTFGAATMTSRRS